MRDIPIAAEDDLAPAPAQLREVRQDYCKTGEALHLAGSLLFLGVTGFMLEALLLGIMGGIVGALIVLPLNGIQTGAMNFQTFTEVAFAFRVTPQILLGAIIFAAMLGILGGAIPAWRAARMRPRAMARSSPHTMSLAIIGS